MIVLGIDPGLRSMGWAVLETQDGRVRLESLKILNSGTLSQPNQRLRDIYECLIDIILQWSPSIVSVEEIFVNVNQASSLKLAQARAMVLLAAQMHDIPLYSYHNRTIKKSVSGYGAAGKTQMISMMKFLFPRVSIQTDHEADAIAVAYTYLTHNQKIA